MNSPQVVYRRMRLTGSLNKVAAYLAILAVIFLSSLVTPQALLAAPGDIATIAGGGVGDTGSAVSASLYLPRGIHVTSSGVIYIADTLNHRIRKIDTNGVITTVAGNGLPGFSGNGGPATSASLKYPLAVVVDQTGNIFIADAHNHRVRKVNTSGIISTIIGGGAENASNFCSIPAAEIGTIFPRDIFLDPSGRVHINDGQLWRLDADGTLINLSDPGCGNGSLEPGFSSGYFDASGAFIYASGNNIFRTTDMQNSTFLGAIPGASTGDFTALSGDSLGTIYVSVPQLNIVHKLDPTGTSTVFAGTGAAGYSGDGGDAVSANISNPTDIFADTSGNVYISDRFNHRIRKVDLNGMITTVGGTGEAGYAGDGSPAISERLNHPGGVYADLSGNIYVADTYNHRVRKIDTSGVMTTLAGNGTCAFSGDGGPASAAGLCYPTGLFVGSDGTIYVADSFNDRIRKIDPAGTITTIAGTEDTGYAGDGGPATEAVLNYPTGVLADGFGNIFIADSGNNAIRRIDASGVISTYINIYKPRAITIDSSGILYVATDYDGVNKVNPDKTVDLLPSCQDAVDVSLDSSGTVYMACQKGNIVRATTPDMKTWLVAGTQTRSAGFSGDGGPATAAMLSSPSSVFMTPSGSLYIADSENNRVRRIEAGFQLAPLLPLVEIWWPSDGYITNSTKPFLCYGASSGTVVVKVDGIVVNVPNCTALGPLANGTHTVRVEATDANGTGFAEITLTVDTVAPIITIASPQIGVSSNNNPVLTYSANEATTGYDSVYLDGSYIYARSGSWIGPLSDGPHSVMVRMSDIAGNSASAAVNFTIDTIPPSGIIRINNGATTTNGLSIILNLLAQDTNGISQMQFSNNGTVWSTPEPYVTSKNWALEPGEGLKTVSVKFKDAAGNWSGAYTASITLDTTAPAVTITSPVAGTGNNKTPLLSYTVSDGTTTVKVDGSVVSKVSGSTLDPLTDGPHTVRVEATDAAGNTGFAEVSFTIDTAAPTITITSPSPGPTRNTTPVLTYTTSDGTVVVKLNGSVIQKVSGDTLDQLTDGTHTVRVEATDTAGNTGFAEVGFVVDTVQPAVSINLVTTPTNASTQAITGTRESGAVVAVALDTSAAAGAVAYPTATTWNCTVSGLVEGTNTVTATATDAAGNSASVGTSIIYDSIAPTVELLSPTAAPTNNNTPTLSYTVGEGTVVVKVDGHAVQKVSGNTLDQLTDGTHTVRVEATDAAGNTGFASVAFVVDTIPPTASVNPVTTPTNVNSQTITGTRESGAAITVSVDASVGAIAYPSATTWNCTVTNLAEGSNALTVTATDAAGNAATVGATIVFDGIAPTVSIASPGSMPTNDNTPLLTYSVSDGTVVVKVDGIIVSKASGDALDALTDGSHTVLVQATDEVGNIGSAQVSFRVDTVAPAISIDPVTTPTKESLQTITGTRESGASVSMTVDTSASVGPMSYGSDATWSCTISGLIRGINVITVKAVDAANNSATATATIRKN